MENSIDHPNLKYIGHLASFYVPSAKLPQVEELCHDFFIANYDAYTREHSDIKGFWRSNPQGPLFRDDNIKYLVSFSGPTARIAEFIDFLATLCATIGEESIYLTMGYKAWLVLPK